MNLDFRPGFMWNCQWRIEWGQSFEYWDRYQLGPFYVLHMQIREYPDDDDDE